jgi:Uma2 family endonuclease
MKRLEGAFHRRSSRPADSYIHEAIANLLAELLRDLTRQHAPGKVLSGRLPIRLWSGQMREPDVVYLTRQRTERLRVPGFESQPDGADLVMEVVSLGDEARERDYVKKRDLYARAGIAEYWIIDPQNETISLLPLNQGAYQTVSEFRRGSVVASQLLPGFEMAVDSVFSAGEPDKPISTQI